jgi:hypothetical protein
MQRLFTSRPGRFDGGITHADDLLGFALLSCDPNQAYRHIKCLDISVNPYGIGCAGRPPQMEPACHGTGGLGSQGAGSQGARRYHPADVPRIHGQTGTTCRHATGDESAITLVRREKRIRKVVSRRAKARGASPVPCAHLQSHAVLLQV